MTDPASPAKMDGRLLRVVHLVSSLNIGGLEMVVVNMMRHCDRTKYEPFVVSLGEAGALAEKIVSLGVPLMSLAGRRRFKGDVGLRLIRLLRSLKPDVIHTHNPSPHLHGALAAAIARVPVLVHTKHGRNCAEPTYSAFSNRLASRLSSYIVSVSEDAAQVARELERVPADKLEVIHNGVDLDRYPFREPRRQREEVRAVHVARLNWIKDQPTLLRAARLVADEEPRFRLDIVGDGPERANVEQLIKELNLEGVVTLHGFRDDVSAQLAKADFFVLSSISEGISLTLLEAMATGLPIVATDVGGNREVVADGETGLLAPAGSPEALAQAMLRLSPDPTLIERMSYTARKRVETRFDLRNAVARYESLYLRLLKQQDGLTKC